MILQIETSNTKCQIFFHINQQLLCLNDFNKTTNRKNMGMRFSALCKIGNIKKKLNSIFRHQKNTMHIKLCDQLFMLRFFFMFVKNLKHFFSRAGMVPKKNVLHLCRHQSFMKMK